MVENIIQLVLSLLLMITSGDILYLYYDVRWIEPNNLIHNSEIIILIIIICLCVYNVMRLLGRLFNV